MLDAFLFFAAGIVLTLAACTLLLSGLWLWMRLTPTPTLKVIRKERL